MVRKSSAPSPTAGTSATTSPFDLDQIVVGAASARSFERRGLVGDREIDEFWGTGRVGRIARTFLDTSFAEPGTRAEPPDWLGETSSERSNVETLERRTDRNRDERAVVLHHRRLPGTRTTIDHLVVAPSGVWIIDAIDLPGKVAQRNIGGWFKHEPRLYVGDVEQSALLAAMDKKSATVERLLERLDVRAFGVDRAVCFTAGEWPRLFAKPFRIADVWVTWPRNLTEMIVADGCLDIDSIHAIGDHLDESLKQA